jgi:predicted DCC family thiol-disulfide oxidoreductase YuxK
MKRLYVLYDQECGLCQKCCGWLARQPAYLELQFIPLQTPGITQGFPGVENLDLRERLVVVSDEGAIYEGQHAWIMCLFALEDYREWAQRLAHPALLPFARRVCELVSRNRLILSRFFLKAPVEELSRTLQAMPPGLCRPGHGGCT